MEPLSPARSKARSRALFIVVLALWLGSFGAGMLAGSLRPIPPVVASAVDADAPTPQQMATAESVWTFLRSRGVSPAGAAGVLGNFQQESSLDPAAQEKGWQQEGRGLAQWSGPRRDALEAAAAKQGVAWSDLDFQLRFMVAELASDYPQLWRDLMTATDPVAAAVQFHDEFERSADSPADVREVRGGAAREWLARLASPVSASAGG